jgi:hypothetical protein
MSAVNPILVDWSIYLAAGLVGVFVIALIQEFVTAGGGDDHNHHTGARANAGLYQKRLQ